MSNFAGIGCEIEPSGSMSFFLPDIGWLDFKLDGPTNENWGETTPECDGCTSAFLKGIPIGEICLDFESLLDWNTNPFEENE